MSLWIISKQIIYESEVAQSCPTLCDPVDCSPPGSSVHGILQARVLEWAAISFSRGSSWSRDRTRVSGIAGRCFNLWATREAQYKYALLFSLHFARDVKVHVIYHYVLFSSLPDSSLEPWDKFLILLLLEIHTIPLHRCIPIHWMSLQNFAFISNLSGLIINVINLNECGWTQIQH